MLPFEIYIKRYKELPPKIYFNIDNIYIKHESTIRIILNEHIDMSKIKKYITEE